MNESFGALPGNLSDPRRAERFVIYKTQSGKNLVTRRPVIHTNHASSNASMQEEIRRAVTYAEFACDQPIYQSKAVGTANTAYNLAVADYLGKPQILDIDIHGWTRKAGQAILIEAKDDVLVLSVRLVIRQGETILEEGEAEQAASDSLIWTYTTQTSVAKKPGIDLDAYAYDIPGNVGEYHLELR
jgi:hypothetical protein